MICQLRAVAADRGLTHLTKIGSGLEFVAYAALTPEGVQVVLKTPTGGRFQSNTNDPAVDTRELLTWEYAVTRHLSARAFPTPRPRELVLGTPDVLITQYIPHDGEPIDQQELGRLLRTLHRMPPPAMLPPAQEGRPTAQLVPQRLLRRWQELRTLIPGLPSAPPDERLHSALSATVPTSLVHLDVRSANLRGTNGAVQGHSTGPMLCSRIQTWNSAGSPNSQESRTTVSTWRRSQPATAPPFAETPDHGSTASTRR
jgi:hypothetical protein